MRAGKSAGFCFAALLLAACGMTPPAPAVNEVPVAAAAEPAADSSPVPPVFCNVSKGSARFADGWRDFGPADFALPPGLRVTVALHPSHGAEETGFQASLDAAGQKMLFCPVIDGPPGRKISCASVYALDDDLDAGIKRTFDIPDAVEGGQLSCGHSADKAAR
jgi:hypothetical protein